ncbi:MAG: ArsA family ATPase [Ilumatobacteraceae bacterium]
MGLNTLVERSDVVVCCGPGGVGKTTSAAVIALHAARCGRRAVVVTIDPARRLGDALGLPGGLTGTPTRIDIDGTGELWAMMLDTPAMFERVVRTHASDPAQADRIAQNRFYRNIASSLGGTQEYMATEALYELWGDDRFDLVVVDTPPSRNALDFLESPGVLTRFLGHPVFKLMMLPSRTGFRVLSVAAQPLLRAIGRVVGSEVLTDAVAFFQAFAGMEAGFKARAEEVDRLLRADTTAFVLVTTPHHDSIDECGWFAQQLHDAGFGVDALVVNRLHPSFGSGSVADAERRARAASTRGAEDVAALWSNLAAERRLATDQRAVVAPLADRTGSTVVEVPLLAADVHDSTTLDHVARHLFA